MMLKGIGAAYRSFAWGLVLLCSLIYVVALLSVFVHNSFVEDHDDDATNRMKLDWCEPIQSLDIYFKNVPTAALSLTMHGIFHSTIECFFQHIFNVSILLASVHFVFFFISNFIVVNMLLGLICNVISEVSDNEKEQKETHAFKSALSEYLECHDIDGCSRMTSDAYDLLLKCPDMAMLLKQFAVNINDFRTLRETLFTTNETISFGLFIKTAMRLRAGRQATVIDITELREFLRHRFQSSRPFTQNGSLSH